jgi:hypothetical protein
MLLATYPGIAAMGPLDELDENQFDAFFAALPHVRRADPAILGAVAIRDLFSK